MAGDAVTDSTRRSLIRAGLAGLAGLALGVLGRPSRADAAPGGSIVMGASNSAGTTNTSLTTDTDTGTAFLVTQNGAGTALRGVATNGIAGFFTSGSGSGVSGVVGHKDKYGVYAANDATLQGTGAAIRANGKQNHGVKATTDLAVAYPIWGTSSAAGGVGVYGVCTATDTGGFGVMGGVYASASNAAAVCGQALADWARGVVGQSWSAHGTGVEGVVHGSGTGIGVLGLTDGTSNTSYGLYGQVGSPDAYALYCYGKAHVYGNLHVTGTLTKAVDQFHIDHPLDPENKYLNHSVVESPELKNVYDGVVTLDAKGEATVTLPEWFEALNRDFRYQLTSIGPGAPDLHVAAKVKDGRFSIGGGKAGQEVSWLLTGIRKDAYAAAHPMLVEEPKPEAERGLYLHPLEHGRTKAKGIDESLHAAARVHGPEGDKHD